MEPPKFDPNDPKVQQDIYRLQILNRVPFAAVMGFAKSGLTNDEMNDCLHRAISQIAAARGYEGDSRYYATRRVPMHPLEVQVLITAHAIQLKLEKQARCMMVVYDLEDPCPKA